MLPIPRSEAAVESPEPVAGQAMSEDAPWASFRAAGADPVLAASWVVADRGWERLAGELVAVASEKANPPPVKTDTPTTAIARRPTTTASSGSFDGLDDGTRRKFPTSFPTRSCALTLVRRLSSLVWLSVLPGAQERSRSLCVSAS